MDMALAEFVGDLRHKSERKRCYPGCELGLRLTSSGTSLLIMSCTTLLRLVLLEKLTRYLRENVRLTCEFSSIRTAFSGKSSSSSSESSFFFFFWDDFLAFFAGLPLACVRLVSRL